MQRVMIVGGPGSGKSTLAVELGRRTGLPVFHMDHIHYAPGWVERTRDEKDRLTADVHRLDRWIFEGGHSRTYADRVARSDTFIWLDVPVAIRLWRVLRRSVAYHGRTRPDLPPDCPERLDMRTVELLRFVWRTRKTARAKLEAIYAAPPPHLRAFRLDRDAAVRRFLDSLI